MQKMNIVIFSLFLSSSISLIPYSYSDSDLSNWLKTTAIWWGNGDLDDKDFFNLVQYLLSQNIITISQNSINNPQNQIIEILNHKMKIFELWMI